MTETDKDEMVDKRQESGRLVPVFRPSFTAYHEESTHEKRDE